MYNNYLQVNKHTRSSEGRDLLDMNYIQMTSFYINNRMFFVITDKYIACVRGLCDFFFSFDLFLHYSHESSSNAVYCLDLHLFD